MGPKPANTSPDAVIARIAANQHGVVSLAQLEQAGLRHRGRANRVAAGRLHRVHRAVFAVGHTGLSREGRWMAAVLACGPDAVLSHTSAGELWGMIRSRRLPSPADVHPSLPHITVPGSARTRRGIHIHRSRTLFPSGVTRRAGIPVTTPTRTLTDLRRLLPQPQFTAALRQAEYLGLALDPALEPDHTRSELEARFLQLCRRHRLPQPEVNRPIGPYVVDFLWPEQRLIVELDGYRAHSGHAAFEGDRARDLNLKALGYEVIRLTSRQALSEPGNTAATVRRLLAHK